MSDDGQVPLADLVSMLSVLHADLVSELVRSGAVDRARIVARYEALSDGLREMGQHGSAGVVDLMLKRLEDTKP